MGLRDFFSRIINKIKGNEIKQLPPPQTVEESNFVPIVEKNAYVNAYTKSMNVSKSTFKINDDGTRLQFTDSKTNKNIEVQRMVKIKENLEIGENQVDLYKAVFAIKENQDRKLKKVYFALPEGKNLLDLYQGSTKKASLKNKFKIMFAESNVFAKKLFLGAIIEDEFYNDYRIAKSAKLEEYVTEIDKKKQVIKANKAKSKEQVRKTLNNAKGMNTAISKAKSKKIENIASEVKNEKVEAKSTTAKKISKQENEKNKIKEASKKDTAKNQVKEIIDTSKKTKEAIEGLNRARKLNKQTN